MNMHVYIVRRLLTGFLTLVGVLTLVFLVIRMVPGDPVEVLLGDFYSPETAAALRAQMSLDKPVVIQYFAYLWDTLRGDFGDSYITGKPVLGQLLRAFPYTAHP